MLGRNNLTPEEKAARAAHRARERAERDRLAAQRRAAQEAARQDRLEDMPKFIVRESREVLVRAANHTDAIALAGAAFKEGQNRDYAIAWGRPFGVEGDTIGPIESVNIKASKVAFE